MTSIVIKNKWLIYSVNGKSYKHIGRISTEKSRSSKNLGMNLITSIKGQHFHKLSDFMLENQYCIIRNRNFGRIVEIVNITGD